MKSQPSVPISVILVFCLIFWTIETVNGKIAYSEEELFDVPLDPNDFENGANVEDNISREQMDEILAQGIASFFYIEG